ncbi:hypothetical protein D3C74_282650 [compost metagenome]
MIVSNGTLKKRRFLSIISAVLCIISLYVITSGPPTSIICSSRVRLPMLRSSAFKISSNAIGWVLVRVQRGRIMTGNLRTSLTKIGNDEPCGPTIKPARIVVTGTPKDFNTRSTSRRLRKCRDSSSSLVCSGRIPLKYTICFTPLLRAARAKCSAKITSISSNVPCVSFAEGSME